MLKMNTGQLLILVQVAEEELKTEQTGPPTGVHHAFMTTPNQYRRAIFAASGCAPAGSLASQPAGAPVDETASD